MSDGREESAFPNSYKFPNNYAEPGMTLRDWFAG